MDEGYVLPPFQLEPPPAEDSYQGAFVLDAERGLHRAVAIVDFASLYPSVCIGWNLCYTTFVPPGAHLPDSVPCFSIDIDGVQHRFVTKDVHHGLLPKVMDHLLSYRKATKKLMKNHAKSDPMYAILDGRQNALKVSANSVYGFCGAHPFQHFQLHRPDTSDKYAYRALKTRPVPAYNLTVLSLTGISSTILSKCCIASFFILIISSSVAPMSLASFIFNLIYTEAIALLPISGLIIT